MVGLANYAKSDREFVVVVLPIMVLSVTITTSIVIPVPILLPDHNWSIRPRICGRRGYRVREGGGGGGHSGH